MAGNHVNHLVNLLSYVAQRNEHSVGKTACIFFLESPEPLRDMVWRLDDNIRCSSSCYAVALVYMDRITEANQDVPLNYRTVNLLFTTALLLANQFLDDKAERALQFARVAGIHPSTMARLKIDFLFRISFSLVVSEQEMCGYSDKLLGRYSTRHFRDMAMWDGTLTSLPRAVGRSTAPFPSLAKVPQPTTAPTTPASAAPTTVIQAQPHSIVVPAPGSKDVFVAVAKEDASKKSSSRANDVVGKAARGIEALSLPSF